MISSEVDSAFVAEHGKQLSATVALFTETSKFEDGLHMSFPMLSIGSTALPDVISGNFHCVVANFLYEETDVECGFRQEDFGFGDAELST